MSDLDTLEYTIVTVFFFSILKDEVLIYYVIVILSRKWNFLF